MALIMKCDAKRDETWKNTKTIAIYLQKNKTIIGNGKINVYIGTDKLKASCHKHVIYAISKTDNLIHMKSNYLR